MEHDLSAHVAVVTGVSSGLGAEVVRGLVAAGARVAAVARREDRLAQLREELGPAVLCCPADVTEEHAVDGLVTRIREHGWTPGVLVNAAGVFGPIAPVVDSDPADWWQALRTNTYAPYLMCRAFAPAMVAAGWGRILNVTSAASLHEPGPLNSAYATSKVALNQLTRHLAAELQGTGVTANVLHPGDVKTEMWGDIRRQAAERGAAAAPFLAWTDWVQETGGDPPGKAVALIVGHVAASTAVTGRFLWIDDPLQEPIPSWGAPAPATPWE